MQDARDGALRRQRDSRRPAAPVDSGHRARPRKPNAPVEDSIRNVAYALLSGADGWMFDGEDALGQISTMSLDNQRNLKLAIHRDPVFMKVAEQVAGEMNQWAQGFFGRPIIDDWKKQLDFTTKIFRAARPAPRRPPRPARRRRRLLRVHRRCGALHRQQPPARCARPARRWCCTCRRSRPPRKRRCGTTSSPRSKQHLGLPDGTIKVYVLVEQVEACFQLMEIRAALGKHFVGFNTGRWDYINSVSDAMAWDRGLRQPEHRRHHDDLRLHARSTRTASAAPCNTPDQLGQCALWQGGMEPNIPVGSEAGVASGMKRAVAGAEREQREGASGKWVAHWKMVHIVRPVWEKAGAGQPARPHVPAADLHAGRRGRPVPARTGAAHRSRRARSAERRAAVRQRLLARASRPPRSSRRTSSATTTCCT